MLERRRHDRIRSFEAATVADARRLAPWDCVVRNLSEGGALLLLDEPRHVPVSMEIALRDGVRPARIVWRSDLAVGVAFAPALPASAGPASAVVVSLDAARRGHAAVLRDERRLAERIARFVRPSCRPDPA